MTNDSQLPAIQNNEFLQQLNITIPAPIILDSTAPISEVRKADIALFNSSLTILYCMWGEVKTFNAALSMIDKTMSLIEKRRAIMGLEYGSPSNPASKAFTFEPIP